MKSAGKQARRRDHSTDLDDALAFRIHRTNRLLRTHLARVLGDEAPGLSPEQWFVLARLSATGCRQVDLAEPALGDPPNVSRLVDALVDRGLAGRESDPSDRRSWLVKLTPDGSALMQRLFARVTTERGIVFDGLSDADLDRLAATLDRIDDNVRQALAG